MQIRTLGAVQLDAPGRPDATLVVAQPKRLALLVYLAAARPHGPQRRDALLALFWPDANQDRGRQILRQTLYLLRQSLGKDAVVTRGDEDMAVVPEVVSCDAVRFEQAIAEGRLPDALDLYGGDFLHGFHAPDVAPEFEEWIAEERRRLRAMAGTAAWTLAAREEKAGNATGALYWARRAVALDRDNEDAVADLMRLHAKLGDRIGAARVFDEHARRLRHELQIEPGAKLVRLAAELRAAVPAETAPRAAPLGLAPAAFPQVPAQPTAAPVGQPTLAPASRPPTAWRRWRSWRPALGALVLLVIGVTVLFRWHATKPRAPLLAVGPILSVSGTDSSAESAVASDLLATSLARLDGIEVIPEVRLYDVQAQLKALGSPSASLLAAARQAGASELLRGTLHRRPDGGLRLDAQVLSLVSGSVVHAFRAEGADLFELVDHATEALAGIIGAQPPPASIQEVTTRSLVAYRLYHEGLRVLYTEWDVRGAYGLFRAAGEEDSTFAMAEYYAGMTGNNIGLPEADTLLRRAVRLAERAPDRERLLIKYRIAHLVQAPEAMALGETLSVRYPSDLDAIFARGALLQRAGQWPAAAAQFRRVIELDSLSLHTRSVRCLACDAYVELWWTWVYGDSLPAAEAAAREWGRRQGPRAPNMELLAVALSREGRDSEAVALWREPGPGNLQNAWIAIRRGDLAAARDTLAQLLRTGPAAMKDEYAWYLAIIQRNQGRVQEALALPDPGGQRPQVLFEAGRYREAAGLYDAAARRVRRDQPRSLPKQLPWNLTHVATCLAAAGDTARLASLADTIESVGVRSNFGRDPPLHHYTRGLLWLARGDTARAVEAFRRSIWSWTDGYTRANYELARALIAVGRPREAIYPLQAALRGDLQSSNLYVTRTELHDVLGRAFEASGALDSAAAHYSLVVRAWDRADPPFASRRAHAAAFLAARADGTHS